VSTLMVPASASDAMKMLEAALGFLADADVTEMPTAVQAECLAGLERADAMEAAARGRLLAAFDAQDGSLSYGQRTTRAWLVHCLRVTKGQAREYLALEALARKHQPLCNWPDGSASFRRSSARRPKRSLSRRHKPGRICRRWPRSAQRSRNAPHRLTLMIRSMIHGWTVLCTSTPPSTVPVSCAVS
jgi:hypothetical protein